MRTITENTVVTVRAALFVFSFRDSQRFCSAGVIDRWKTLSPSTQISVTAIFFRKPLIRWTDLQEC